MKDEIPAELKVLCPFCRAVWTAKMGEQLDFISQGYASGGGEVVELTVEIVCEGCGRVVYRKECRLEN